MAGTPKALLRNCKKGKKDLGTVQTTSLVASSSLVCVLASFAQLGAPIFVHTGVRPSGRQETRHCNSGFQIMYCVKQRGQRSSACNQAKQSRRQPPRLLCQEAPIRAPLTSWVLLLSGAPPETMRRHLPPRATLICSFEPRHRIEGRLRTILDVNMPQKATEKERINKQWPTTSSLNGYFVSGNT